MDRPTVLLTGASGSMGHEAFLELRRRGDDYATRVLLRPSKVNRKMFAPYAEESWLEIVWGDLTDSADVDRAVEGVDFVLHPAAMISPAADRNPSAAHAINVGGTRNLVDSILRQPDGAERIRLVGVGSVAQYGDRLPPVEMIRVGDPMVPSVHDYYSLTKCAAERLIVESGIRHWASLRQTFIVPPQLLGLLDPILFHQPLNQRIELITSRDAGYGLVQCLETSDDFWGRIYNMSGGPSCRVVYEEFLADQFEVFGLGDYRKIFDPNWFALKNFHCGYFADSGELNQHLGHFRDTLDDCYAMVEEGLAPWMKLGARLAPARLVKALARRWAEPLQWIKEDNTPYIEAFFGSRAAWEAIPGWADREPRPARESRQESEAAGHGRAAAGEVGAGELADYAKSRGGVLLSPSFTGMQEKHRWRCGQGHEFDAMPRLLVGGGYWCDQCFPSAVEGGGWEWERQARIDPAVARILGSKPLSPA